MRASNVIFTFIVLVSRKLKLINMLRMFPKGKRADPLKVARIEESAHGVNHPSLDSDPPNCNSENNGRERRSRAFRTHMS
jgi:hypothetical protein